MPCQIVMMISPVTRHQSERTWPERNGTNAKMAPPSRTRRCHCHHRTAECGPGGRLHSVVGAALIVGASRDGCGDGDGDGDGAGVEKYNL